MNRIVPPMAALLSALMPLVFDSALKGAVLLLLAALTTLALWRASAATRHLAWLIAVVALLVLPLLSFALPQWRVLPRWAAAPVVEPAQAPPLSPPDSEATGTEVIQPFEQLPTRVSEVAATAVPKAVAETAVPAAEPRLASRSPLRRPAWPYWLPVAWGVGVALIALRLLASHVFLRLSSRSCRKLTAPPDDRIADIRDAALAQLNVTQRVTVLLDEKRTIPVVWGVFHPRLLLPVEARTWSDDQLRSVLLHELAHIKRRDTLVQWLTQIACALHWWNPLVWLAAWRLHAERERACDDLVLASGVRPSAYAEHLLHIATKLSPARWTGACGLAMARKSSLETRLLAVLSGKLNRSGVTRALTVAALILGAVIAIPIEMLRAADEKWNPPTAAHIGSNDFGVYCVHDGKDAAFILAYRGETGSSSAHDSNPKTRTWTDSGTLTAKKPGIALSFHRAHTSPGKLTLTTTPAEARDLGKPAPPQREFGKKEYDLTKGRVFLLGDNGSIRQINLRAPVVTDQASAKNLAALIAAIPLEERGDIGAEGYSPPAAADAKLDAAKVLTPTELQQRFYATRKEPLPVGIGARAVLIRSLTLDITGKLPTQEERTAFENDNSPDALGKVIARLVAKSGKQPQWLLDSEQQKVKPEPPKGAAAKLTPDALIGAWSGTMNGESLLISFHRPPVETKVQVDIYTGDATIGALGAFTIAADGKSVALGVHDGKGGQVPFGTLYPGEAGTMRLVLPDDKGGDPERGGIVLTGGRGAPATEPEQKEARELFEMWKRTANDDGTIPGTFIGALATEVRAYVRANPNLNSGMALPKLLPRFVTTRDWAEAEAIKLLDDVAYYATEPIAARVAKAKLGSGPMWRTMVEFQDLPVQIAKWSEVKDGLRIGLRVVGGQWSAGGSVRVELWLHNASGKDVSFRTAGPNRQDVEVMFTAIDAEGHEHWPERNPTLLFALMMDCTLPAGHVAMAKEFDVTFADADNDLWSPLGHRFRDLKPGKYQLRSVLMLAKPEPAKSDEHIELTTPDFAFTLGGATAADETKPAPKSGAANERVKGQPRDWKVRVVDGSTGREQAGVTVVAWVFPREGGEGRRVEHVADGRDWAIKLADNEHATLACEDAVWVGGGASFHIGNLPPENPNAFGDREGARHTDPDKPLELRVWRGDTVKRRVLLPGGKPAAGVHVMLGARVDSQEWMRRLGVMNMSRFSFDHGEFSNWHSTAVTNERGEFEGAFPPSEACTFTTITCRTKDSLNYEQKWETAPQGDEKHIIQLESGVRVRGRVVDTDGKPVAGAQVYTTGQHRHENTYALTDTDGRYELRARPGVSQVSVDIRERNEKGEVTSHNATGIHAPENVAIPEGAAEFARDFRIMRVTDAGPVLPPEGKPQRARDAAVSFARYGKPIGEFGWVEGPWGPEKDGLSMALELDTNKTDQWRAGGSVQGELYVRNNSAAPVTFPQHFAMHVGLAVTARDKDGKEHPARITMWETCPALHHLTLPPGHAARVKTFSLQLDALDAAERKSGGWLSLAPGPYKLRARWSDAHAMWAHEGEWTGTLESGEVDFAVAARTANAEDGGKP